MQKMGGFLVFLAGVVLLLGILIAEIFYPPIYSISRDMISTLGASPPPHSVVKEPSAAIFDTTMIVSGLLLIVGFFKLRKLYKGSIFIGLSGIGALGVGIFPAFHPVAHPIAALMAFSMGGIAAIASYKIQPFPFSLISVFLGIITLIFLFLGTVFPKFIVPILGAGGTERLVAYPLFIWLISFGVYLMSNRSKISKA